MKPLRLADLVRDHGTGRLSHTKIWSNIGYAAMTAAFMRDAWLGGLDGDKLLWYGAIVVSGVSISKLISLRYGPGVGNAYVADRADASGQ